MSRVLAIAVSASALIGAGVIGVGVGLGVGATQRDQCLHALQAADNAQLAAGNSLSYSALLLGLQAQVGLESEVVAGPEDEQLQEELATAVTQYRELAQECRGE